MTDHFAQAEGLLEQLRALVPQEPHRLHGDGVGWDQVLATCALAHAVLASMQNPDAGDAG